MDNFNLPFSELSDVFASQFNQGGSTAENMNAPKQQGDYRIPRPAGFRVLSTGSFAWGGSYYVLAWTDIVDTPDCPVKGYRIYASNAINSAAEPYQVGGQTLPLEACPTCTAVVPEPSYSLTVTDPNSAHETQVRIDDDLTSGGGGTTSGLQVRDTVDGDLTNINSRFIETLNGNGKLGVGAALSGSIATAAGVGRYGDGTGTGAIVAGVTVQLEGANGKVRCYDKGTSTEVGYRGEHDTTPPGAATTRYLVIELGGVRYKIQCDSEA